MKKPLLSLTASLAFEAASAGAAISVGPAGSEVLTFDSLPAVGQWSTFTIEGSGASFTNAAALDAAVQLLSASNISGTLPTTSALPPSVSGGGAYWNSDGRYLQTRPGGVAAVLLMATLRNDSLAALPGIWIFYSLYVFSPISEELPGHRVYFSTTGLPNSWELIRGASGIESAGVVSAAVELCSWPDGGVVYVLWADDNGDGLTDAGYAIDNFEVGQFTFPQDQPPRLTITRFNTTRADLAWPFPSIGCQLQSTTDLAAGRWEAVPGVGPPVEGFYHVTVDISTGKRFFRLQKP